MSLTNHLVARIREDGPLSIADYMRDALTHPDYGYYTQHQPLGADGDFTTAPEISQMFGELLGAWCVAVWHSMGAPSPFTLIEPGPGRGTLMRDMLRAALQLAPAWHEAAQICMIEVSEPLILEQRTLLEPLGCSISWHDSLNALPDMPILLVANEFLDALPIQQWFYRESGWHERQVHLAENNALVFGEAKAAEHPPGAPTTVAPGDIYEYCPEAHQLMQQLATHATTQPLAALFIDYGYTAHEHGDSLQAMQNHRYHDVLQNPGMADLTAHVDFARLADTARTAGARIHGPVTQGAFLQTLGIGSRAATLCRNASPQQQRDVYQALHRLTASEEMGRLFKVMALSSPSLPTLPALEHTP